MKSEILPIVLPREHLQRLEEMARSQDRTAVQQARYILKRAISRYPNTAAPERELVEA